MSIPQNAQTIYEYLVGQGLSANAAAGIVGNIEQESGGSPTAGSMGGGYGLIQWTPGTAYFKSPPTFEQQLPAIMDYINSNGSVADINANASSPATAALYFSSKYERPLASAANNPNRMQSAVDVALAAQTGKWQGSKSPGGSAKTAGSTPTYGGTRPGGQPTTPDGSSSDTGDAVTSLLTSYGAEVSTPRTAPASTFTSPSKAGLSAPFQWWWQSWSGTYAQEQSGEGG